MEIVAGLPLKYLRLESSSNPMNMSQVVLFKSQGSKKFLAPTLDAVKYAVMQQITCNKTLRQRLVESPFQLANPVWIDDPHMDINYHIEQKILTGTDHESRVRQLLELTAEDAAVSLDRGSPLWRLHYITFTSSDCFALVCIVHRALLCRLHQKLFDALFPSDIDLLPENKIESLIVECPKTGSKFGFSWLPESLPSRNELLNLAKTDWLTLPKQTKAFGSLVFGRWAKRRIANALVDKNDMPPSWISAPHSIFNQPTGKNRDLAFVDISPQTSRKLLRIFKGFQMRDLILALLSRTLKKFLGTIDHHTKDELVALVQSTSLSTQPCPWEQETSFVDYQLLRLPTNIEDPLEQLRSILERKNTAREYNELFENQGDLGQMPSSMLSLFIHTYNKLNIHHFHKPFCNLVISEQPPTRGAQKLNGFNRVCDASFASLLPNVGLHVSYWLDHDNACIAFTTGSTNFKAEDLSEVFSECLENLEELLTANGSQASNI